MLHRVSLSCLESDLNDRYTFTLDLAEQDTCEEYSMCVCVG
jgi:hypothetical protein